MRLGTENLTNQHIQITWVDDHKERGVIATADFKGGDVILEDDPIVCDQYLYNKDYFPACSHCLRSLETASQMARRLAGYDSEPQLYAADHLKVYPRISCDSCSREIYCSEQCKSAAWVQYHSILCLGHNPPMNHPLSLLEQEWKSFHYPPETASIMIIPKIIATVISNLNKGLSIDESLSPFANFKKDYRNQELNILHKFLDEKFQERITKLQMLVKEALWDERVPELFEMEGFKSLFCLICLNAQGIGTSSFEQYERHVLSLNTSTSLPDSEKDILSIALSEIDSIRADIEETSGEFTHAEGSGLYPIHSCLNHSCEPNAEIRFGNGNSRLEVVAIRDVKEGEEITISYISFDCCDHEEESESDHELPSASSANQSEVESIEVDDFNRNYSEGNESEDGDDHDHGEDSYVNRQRILKDYYLFECRCNRCEREGAEMGGMEVDGDENGKGKGRLHGR
ncbi:hypothetical protein BKA69DRAFT_1084911 [Paraphysoderma sedebokerense]|nr:hypothetical protein BKA69DRAFT_1084911 [Paraphysoderma sedebokerense]